MIEVIFFASFCLNATHDKVSPQLVFSRQKSSPRLSNCSAFYKFACQGQHRPLKALARYLKKVGRVFFSETTAAKLVGGFNGRIANRGFFHGYVLEWHYMIVSTFFLNIQ